MSNNSTEARRRKAEETRGRTERRVFEGGLELRDAGEGSLEFHGWPCLTDVSYEVGSVERGGFVETVRAGSFSRSLNQSPGPDVVLLVNHGDSGTGMPIARTRSGTLQLEGADRPRCEWSQGTARYR